MKKLLLCISILSVFAYSSAQILTPNVDSIPMRDGKKLAADVYVPSGAGPWPTILIQTPYNRQLYRFGGLPLGIKYAVASMNYTFVILDWRGFYGSAAAINGIPNRGEDGYDAVEWIATQTWNDGKVGTWGPSALGRVQFMTAKENPPSLTCAAPLVAGSQYSFQEYFPGGVYRTEYVQQLDALGFGMSTTLLAHPVKDIFWDFCESEYMYPGEIHVPLLMIGGWYDHNTNVMVELFDSLRKYGDPSIKDEHRLLMGPWAHGGSGIAQVGSEQQGDLHYPAAEGWSDSLAMAFFEYYLRSQPNNWNATQPVQYFQMGEDAWANDTCWPPANIPQVDFFLRQNGKLSFNSPTEVGASANYNYDPSDPSPTVGGSTLRNDLDQGPYDEAPIVESRNDILIFSSDSLTFPLRLKGNPRLHLFVSSSEYDTDFSARLTDVYPDGRSMLVSDGIFRMRFLNSWYSTDSIQPGTVYEIDIELPHTALTILPGHRLRVDVTSSNNPRFDANLNDGGPMYTAGDTTIANNTVFFNPAMPSRLILPLENASVGIKNEMTVRPFNIRIFPQPANEEISFIVNGMKSGTSTSLSNRMKITDLSGRVLLEKEIQVDSYTHTFSTAHLPNGIYFLSVENTGAGEKATGRITVIHP